MRRFRYSTGQGVVRGGWSTGGVQGGLQPLVGLQASKGRHPLDEAISLLDGSGWPRLRPHFTCPRAPGQLSRLGTSRSGNVLRYRFIAAPQVPLR